MSRAKTTSKPRAVEAEKPDDVRARLEFAPPGQGDPAAVDRLVAKLDEMLKRYGL